jgi:hypothetical protein
MLLLILFILAGTPTQSIPAKSIANEPAIHLYQACRAYVRVLNSQEEKGDMEMAGYCAGYEHGILTLTGTSPNLFCASHASMGVITRVYISYMDKNPKLIDDSESRGFLMAMKENYPCPQGPE